jgi:hypothetical protein
MTFFCFFLPEIGTQYLCREAVVDVGEVGHGLQVRAAEGEDHAAGSLRHSHIYIASDVSLVPRIGNRGSFQGSIFRSENDIYSPPPSENDIFPPLATCHFLTPIVVFLHLFVGGGEYFPKYRPLDLSTSFPPSCFTLGTYRPSICYCHSGLIVILCWTVNIWQINQLRIGKRHKNDSLN